MIWSIIKDFLASWLGDWVKNFFFPEGKESQNYEKSSFFDLFNRKDREDNRWKIVEQIAKDTQDARQREKFLIEKNHTNFNRIVLMLFAFTFGGLAIYILIKEKSIKSVIISSSILMVVFHIIRESTKFEFGMSQAEIGQSGADNFVKKVIEKEK